MRVELWNLERVILEEIENPKINRNSVALTYAFCLRENDQINYRRINRAILDRWTFSSLEYIKARAWGIYEGRIRL